ncbi:Exportin-6 [Triplophysa tibetana]|uniref:Exportin-6 n=1 Tax=Triplophysa tibetana TaxID=1572043 RepID=A0A5A9N9X9_9TELE|nr:Exportin-6 [Triplophysa tibetana]
MMMTWMKKILNLLSVICLCTAQQKWTKDTSELDQRDKSNGKSCSNLTQVLDNWKYAIMYQVKDLLVNNHASVLPDYIRIQGLSDAMGDLYKQFDTLKENLGKLSSKFDRVESFVDDHQARRFPRPKLWTPMRQVPQHIPLKNPTRVTSKELWAQRLRARRGPAMEDDVQQEFLSEFKEKQLGGWQILQLTAGTGLAVYAVWAGVIMPGFRRVPLKLQVPYMPASRSQVCNVMTLLKGRSGGIADLGSEACRRGFSPAVGYELNPWLVRLSCFHAWRAGFHRSVSYRREDLWKLSLLQKKLLSELPEDAVIVAGRFPFREWTACRVEGEGVDRAWAYHESEEASLQALESLMTEFFHSCTTNDRKREIEELLNSFAGQSGSWRHCLYFLFNSRNEYVMMYSLTVFENLVNKMWVGVASEDKGELRSCLPKLLLSQHALLPFFIRNKLCKVIVDIGRQDWPMFYHDFFSNTLQLVQSPSLAPLGLVLLKMTSEELVCPREDLSVARKEELKKLLLEQIPNVLNLLTGVLAGNSSPMILDGESGSLCLLALECLAQLFSWIPLSSSITPSLLASIFHFARFGCQQPTKTKPLPTSNGDSAPGRHPANGDGGLSRTETHNTHSQSNTHTIRNRLQELDESYVEKFTDFLRLFVSVHLRRIESNAQFPLVEFLALLFKYTFNQPSREGYLACLEIWSIFLDYLTTKIRSRLADRDSVMNRYKDALVLLLREVLNRIQFRINQSELEELDDETLDDDQQTEWQRYLRQSLEVVAKVMELLPSQTFSVLFPVLRENLDIYLGLQQFIVTSGTSRRLNITAEADCRRLHCALRDLSSLLQAVGRLAEFFTGDVFSGRFNDALTIVQRLVEVSCYGSQISLYDVEMAVPSVLKPDLIDVHAQSLAALQAYSHWLAQFCSEAQRQQHQTQFVDLITSSMAATTPLINAKVPEKLLLSACHLLVSMATTVRPVFLMSLPAVQNIFNMITENHNHRLPQEAHVLVCRALSNMLLLPWPSLPEAEQQWPSRSANHARLINSLTQQYRLLPRPPDHHPTSKDVIQQTVCVLKDLVDSISGEATKSRQICYHSLQESVQVTLALFPRFIQQPDVTDEMLSFFLMLFQALRVQMGVAFTEQIIQTFLNMFTREQLAVSILQEGSSGSNVVQKFLKILQVVVQEPGQSFKPLLPSILSLCLDQVYPIVSERSCPDVKAEMFELLFQILHHNWRFFFKTSVLSSVQRSGAEEVMENQAQFTSAMQVFGQSFLQPDIHIFKQNLSYLEILNSKHKLYHRKLFRNAMLFHFLNVLLQVLLHKSHDLLQDDITLALYNMAAVDFPAFYSSFLPEFLNGCQGLDPHQRTTLARHFTPERDLPSFSQGVYRLVNDLRFYRLCNGSLPQGTLKL